LFLTLFPADVLETFTKSLELLAISNVDSDDLKCNVELTTLLAGNFRFLIGHPESFLDSEVLDILSKVKWNCSVRHIVVDEAHCVVSWGENFRPKFKEIDQLAAIFPHAAMVALTATATLRMHTYWWIYIIQQTDQLYTN